MVSSKWSVFRSRCSEVGVQRSSVRCAVFTGSALAQWHRGQHGDRMRRQLQRREQPGQSGADDQRAIDVEEGIVGVGHWLLPRRAWPTPQTPLHDPTPGLDEPAHLPQGLGRPSLVGVQVTADEFLDAVDLGMDGLLVPDGLQQALQHGAVALLYRRNPVEVVGQDGLGVDHLGLDDERCRWHRR